MLIPREARAAARARREREWELAWMESPAMEAPGHRAWRLWLPVALSALVQIPSVFITFPGVDSGVGEGTEIVVPFALALLGPVALIGARRFPGPVVAVVAVLATLDLLVAADAPGPPYVALAFAIVGSIARGARLWAWLSVAVCWVGALLFALVTGAAISPGRITAVTLGVLILMGIGEAVRTRRDRMDQMRTTIAQRRRTEVEAERIRIARELHDVLAHSLSQINVQAGVGLHLMDSRPELAAEALSSIKSTSKAALDEVRTVLGMLRAESDASMTPEADLSRLGGFVETLAGQGVELTLDVGIVTEPPAAVQSAIYRIVQESLTNVVRHSGAATVTVTLRQTATDYVVSVRDAGRGGPLNPGSGAGRGLLGMRERAELLGGSLHTTSTPGDGFTVRAVIPIVREAPDLTLERP